MIVLGEVLLPLHKGFDTSKLCGLISDRDSLVMSLCPEFRKALDDSSLDLMVSICHEPLHAIVMTRVMSMMTTLR